MKLNRDVIMVPIAEARARTERGGKIKRAVRSGSEEGDRLLVSEVQQPVQIPVPTAGGGTVRRYSSVSHPRIGSTRAI